MPDKIDLRRELKALYTSPKGKFVEVDVPPLAFLMVDGRGDPNVAVEYREAIEALYSVAYTLKFAQKKEGRDFAVGALEGLWWADDADVFITGDRAAWQWTMMIAVPDFVERPMVDNARRGLSLKRNLPAIDRLRLEVFAEGEALQTLYIGPYAGEGPTIAGLHARIAELGKRLHGKHHEIYLSDPRRTAPEKLKTILRQPYR